MAGDDFWIDGGQGKIKVAPELATHIAALLGCYSIRARRSAVKARDEAAETGSEDAERLRVWNNTLQSGLAYVIRDLLNGQYEDLVQKAYDEFGGMPGTKKPPYNGGDQRQQRGDSRESPTTQRSGDRRNPPGNTQRPPGQRSGHPGTPRQGGSGRTSYGPSRATPLAGSEDGEAPF